MNRRRTLLGLSLAVALASARTAHADGCFVWDKERDIAGPTQKAILFYADGRQDLLLQVRYEGPVERFGWLIPVPGLPTVRLGSMECFYELSKLTQQRFPDPHGGRGGPPSGVRVVEIKTVGDYEVAVLSPSDGGSLDRWLSEQRYVVPTDDAGIVEEYIRAGWYFIAAKIQLNRAPRFKLATVAARSPAASRRRIADLRTKLATGELHPLLISFNTPRCVCPLSISALNGGPCGDGILGGLTSTKSLPPVRSPHGNCRRTRKPIRASVAGPGSLPRSHGPSRWRKCGILSLSRPCRCWPPRYRPRQGCSPRHDARASPVRYLELLNDTNPKVRASAALALYHTQPGSISQPEVLRLLRDPDPDVRAKAVVFAPMVYPAIPRADWLRLLGDPRMDTVWMVLRHFQLGRSWHLTAEEVAPLLRNDLIEARVMGLEVLQRLGGAPAVELAMPLLRDPDPVVRKRAWFFFEVVAGTYFAGDPARVEKWWAERQTGPVSDKDRGLDASPRVQ